MRFVGHAAIHRRASPPRWCVQRHSTPERMRCLLALLCQRSEGRSASRCHRRAPLIVTRLGGGLSWRRSQREAMGMPDRGGGERSSQTRDYTSAWKLLLKSVVDQSRALARPVSVRLSRLRPRSAKGMIEDAVLDCRLMARPGALTRPTIYVAYSTEYRGILPVYYTTHSAEGRAAPAPRTARRPDTCCETAGQHRVFGCCVMRGVRTVPAEPCAEPTARAHGC